MKFLAQALALVGTTFSLVEARKTFTKDDLNQKVADGKYDRKKLLRHAVPYKPEGAQRRAEDGDATDEYFNDEYPSVELTSNFKIQFNSCFTLETENYNLLLDNLVNYAKAGTIVSVRNFVLFDVCDGAGCEEQTYLVDLPTFIEAVMDYRPSQQDAICEACDEFGEEFCGDAYVYNHNRGRRLEYGVFDDEMCALCEEYECWEDNQGDQQLNYDAIEEWIASLAECSENEYFYWQGLTTYSGWMCNADGSGIEIGVFLDEQCYLYQKQLTYLGYLAAMGDQSSQYYQYYYQSQDVLPPLFQDIIECREMSSVEFVDEETYATYQATGSTGDGPVNDVCSGLFNGDFVPRSTSNCGEKQNWNANYNPYQNNGNGNENYQSMYQYIQSNSIDNSTWYTYDLDFYEVLDEAAICQKVVSKYPGQSAAQNAASSSNTGINNVYSDTSSSKSFWTWNNGKQTSSNSTNQDEEQKGTWLFPTRNNRSSIQTASARLSPLEILSIVLACIALTILFMHSTRKLVLKKRLRKQEEKEVYVRTDKTGQPLIVS